jgi:hypothetical protein
VAATVEPRLERAAASAGGPLTIRRDAEVVKVEGGFVVDDEFVPVSSRHDVRPAGPWRYGRAVAYLAFADAAEAALAA